MPPCPSHLINGLLQNILDLLIGCFCLTACLRMVGGCDVMLGPEFLEKVLEGSIDEMRPSVTDYHPRCAKPWKDNLMEHFFRACLASAALHGKASTHLET